MGQYMGDWIVTDLTVIGNPLTVATCQTRWQADVGSDLLGGLIIAGGNAVILGKISRNVLNNGKLLFNGVVAGKIVGEAFVDMGAAAHASRDDLPVEPPSEDFQPSKLR